MEEGGQLEAQLTRAGNKWYYKNLPVVNGQQISIGQGWTAIVHTRRNRDEVEVSLNGELQYKCLISGAQRVWLFNEGAAEVAKVDGAHISLAHRALAALAERPSGPGVRVKVTLLPHGKTLRGTTFRTRMGANNHFTDGSLERLSYDGPRITMRCVAASYLVKALRHEGNRDIFAVEITAQGNYHGESLERCLRHLT